MKNFKNWTIILASIIILFLSLINHRKNENISTDLVNRKIMDSAKIKNIEFISELFPVYSKWNCEKNYLYVFQEHDCPGCIEEGSKFINSIHSDCIYILLLGVNKKIILTANI